MGNVALNVLQKSLNLLLKKGTNPANRSCWSWSFVLSKNFLLFQQIYVTAGHVLSENALLIETFRPPTEVFLGRNVVRKTVNEPLKQHINRITV